MPSGHGSNVFTVNLKKIFIPQFKYLNFIYHTP